MGLGSGTTQLLSRVWPKESRVLLSLTVLATGPKVPPPKGQRGAWLQGVEARRGSGFWTGLGEVGLSRRGFLGGAPNSFTGSGVYNRVVVEEAEELSQTVCLCFSKGKRKLFYSFASQDKPRTSNRGQMCFAFHF